MSILDLGNIKNALTGLSEIDIYLTDEKKAGRNKWGSIKAKNIYMFPVLPPTIEFESPFSYEKFKTINKGTVVLPCQPEPRKISWKSFFPNQSYAFVKAGSAKPDGNNSFDNWGITNTIFRAMNVIRNTDQYDAWSHVKYLEKKRETRQPLRLIITGASWENGSEEINSLFYITRFIYFYNTDLDVHYEIEFSEFQKQESRNNESKSKFKKIIKVGSTAPGVVVPALGILGISALGISGIVNSQLQDRPSSVSINPEEIDFGISSIASPFTETRRITLTNNSDEEISNLEIKSLPINGLEVINFPTRLEGGEEKSFYIKYILPETEAEKADEFKKELEIKYTKSDKEESVKLGWLISIISLSDLISLDKTEITLSPDNKSKTLIITNKWDKEIQSITFTQKNGELNALKIPDKIYSISSGAMEFFVFEYDFEKGKEVIEKTIAIKVNNYEFIKIPIKIIIGMIK